MTMMGDYAGDVSPNEAMEMLKADETAVLVDVRTQPEWSFVGVPDLSSLGREPVFLEWQTYPSMAQNEDFIPTLARELARQGIAKTSPVLFLCRSGARSRAAAKALAAQGFTGAYNIAGGFEGGPDPSRHRGTIEGWKALDLPWLQP